MKRVSDEELEAFERRVEEALLRGDEDDIEIIGYGEVTTVLAMESSVGRRAVKRVPPLPDETSAQTYTALVEQYVAALSDHGVDPVETHVHVVPRSDGRPAVYCVQPSLPAGSLGPDAMRALDVERACQAYERILGIIRGVVSDRLAPDGQLSNWAFLEDRILYIDVTTPFMRDDAGAELLDWDQQLQALPAPLRPAVQRWIAPHLLDKYYTLRGQVVDLLGNLIKERLDHLVTPFRERSNELLSFSPPISDKEVRDYYAGDARAYAFLQAARRADRWWHRTVLRRPYPYFLPPRIDRNV